MTDPAATMDFSTDHVLLWKKCPYKLWKSLLQHNPISALRLHAQSAPNSHIFTQNMAKKNPTSKLFLYNVTAHFPLWWKTLVSHKILRLRITLEAIPEPSFTKHSLTQSQQQSNENMKKKLPYSFDNWNLCNKFHVFIQRLIISTTKSIP